MDGEGEAPIQREYFSVRAVELRHCSRPATLNGVGLLESVEVDLDVLLLHALLNFGGAGERAPIGVE